MPSDPILTREELKDHLETMEGHVRRMRDEVTQALDDHLEEMREDHASSGDRIGETFDRVRRDVTRTLWIGSAFLILYVTAVTFLALHFLG